MSNIVKTSNNEEEIVSTLILISDLEHKYEGNMHLIYNAFILIEVMCYFNLMFFISQLLQLIFLKKIGRNYTFPTVSLFTDFVLFAVSVVNIYWIYYNITWNTHHPGLSAEEMLLREVANLMENLTFKFEYLYAVTIVCLLWRIIELIQFHAEVGPLVKIVEKMTGDFVSFFVFYFILVIMFSIVGGVNFIFYLKSYHGVFESILTVLDASIGNYNF